MLATLCLALFLVMVGVNSAITRDFVDLRINPPFAFFQFAYALSKLGIVIAFPTALTLGLAWHALATRMCLTRLAHYEAAGLATGAALGLAFLALTYFSPYASNVPHFTLFAIWGAAVGFFAGAIAWGIRRPDRDGAPTRGKAIT